MNMQSTALLDTSIARTAALQTQSISSGVLPGLQANLPQSPSASALSETYNLSTTIIDTNLITLAIDPGETLETARNLGSLSGSTQISGWVGSTDAADVYRLQLNTNNLNVSLTGLGADADLQVIRDVNSNGVIDYGDILAGSRRGSTFDETINLSGLGSGDYFVEVRYYSGDTRYTLKISDSFTNDQLGVETDLGDLTGTRVFSGRIDNNNTSDVYKFTASSVYNVNISLSGLSADSDVRLIQDTNGNGMVDSTDVVAYSSRGGIFAEKINSGIPGWTYFVQVNQYSGATDYHLGISQGDWFNTSVGDDNIMGEARYAYYNGIGIDRNEMITLLRSAENYGTIDGTELSSLRTIVANAGGLGIADYVRVLANKVVNSDSANARSGIGNLYSGSSSDQMEQLVGKWFLGTDRPTAAGTYRYASGSLFQNGISYSDVDQGQVGDCYFLASLGAVALKTPGAISNMFTDNGDGTFTVRFFNNGTADYVTVDRYLPTYDWGNFIYANDSSGMAYDDIRNELWVALAEKAYAQISQSGWTGQDTANSYEAIAGGWAKTTLSQIRGIEADANWMNLSSMWSAFAAGRSVALHTNGTTEAGIVGNHVYTLTGYNYSTGKYTVYNPWGGSDGFVELTGTQLMNNFSQWDSVA